MLQKLDASRDLAGSFFAPGDWRKRLGAFGRALDAFFDIFSEEFYNEALLEKNVI